MRAVKIKWVCCIHKALKWVCTFSSLGFASADKRPVAIIISSSFGRALIPETVRADLGTEGLGIMKQQMQTQVGKSCRCRMTMLHTCGPENSNLYVMQCF